MLHAQAHMHSHICPGRCFPATCRPLTHLLGDCGCCCCCLPVMASVGHDCWASVVGMGLLLLLRASRVALYVQPAGHSSERLRPEGQCGMWRHWSRRQRW